jgi:hypothetical protein
MFSFLRRLFYFQKPKTENRRHNEMWRKFRGVFFPMADKEVTVKQDCIPSN